MVGLFPSLYREPCELTYQAAGFQLLTWCAGDSDDREDEHDGTEPCCEEEGAQCDGGEDYRDHPVNCGCPGALFGMSIGLEPFANPAKVPTRDLITGAINEQGAM
jgi:hypothetical protein